MKNNSTATFNNMTTKYETITKEIAEKYIEKNAVNRKLKPKEIETLARELKRGEYKTTHQGIAFYEDGELADGQNRLLSIIRSGIPATMLVTRGMPRETRDVIDIGAKRSVNDAFVIESKDPNGSPYSKILANSCITSGLNKLAEFNYNKGKFVTADIKRLFNEFKDSTIAIYDNVVNKSGYKKNACILGAAIASCACGVDADLIGKFFGVFYKDDIAGCDGCNVTAALNWRRQIDDAKARRVSIDRKKLYLGTQNAIYHFVNNTCATRIVAPSVPRYDIKDRVFKALDCE